MEITQKKVDHLKGHNFVTTTAWAQDFVYAVEARSWICKLLFRLAVGRYAWREFSGMVESLIDGGGYLPNLIGYELTGQAYHKEDVTLWGIR